MSREIDRIKDAIDKFNVKHTFEPGQIVRWKPGLRNMKTEGPFVVSEVLDEPVYDNEKKGSGSPYFREPLDIIVGFLDSDGDLIFLHFDSRRLEPVPE